MPYKCPQVALCSTAHLCTTSDAPCSAAGSPQLHHGRASWPNAIQLSQSQCHKSTKPNVSPIHASYRGQATQTVLALTNSLVTNAIQQMQRARTSGPSPPHPSPHSQAQCKGTLPPHPPEYCVSVIDSSWRVRVNTSEGLSGGVPSLPGGGRQ